MLRGYVNESSFLVCVVFAVAWLTLPLKKTLSLKLRWTSVDTYFALLMAWFAGVVLVHALLRTSPAVTKNHVAALIQNLGCYAAMRYFPLDRVQPALRWLSGIFAFAVLFAAQADLNILIAGQSDNLSAANYQGLARAFLITSAFGYAGAKLISVRSIGYFFTICVLFLMGARSEIFGALVLFFLIESIYSRRPVRFFLVVGSILALGAAVLLGSLDALSELFPGNRLLMLLTMGGDDGSVMERKIYQDLSWTAVFNSPITGDYGHYERVASAGAYAHNWLSIWVDLGLIGLVLYIILHCVALHSVLLVYRAAVRYGDEGLKRQTAISIAFLIMVGIFNLFSKTFTDTGLATAAGLVSLLSLSRPINKFSNSMRGPDV